MILKVSLREEGTGRSIAGLIRPTVAGDLLLWAQWRYQEGDLDRSWKWRCNFEDCMRSGGRLECYSLLARDALQGLMVLNLRGKALKIERGKGLIIDYLAANPTNRVLAEWRPAHDARLQGTGTCLLAAAIERSRACGMSGRIWLESLSDHNTRQFYENRGFVHTGRVTTKGNLVYNLASETSQVLMRTLTEKGVVSYEREN